MRVKDMLTPSLVIKRVVDAPVTDLSRRGFRVALLDLDNTLANDHVSKPSNYSKEAIAFLQNAGFACCIVSNARSTRSAEFAAELDIQCVSFARKPSPSGIYRALELMQAKSDEAVFFGDQIFTDIVAANRAGVYSILVERIHKKEVLYVRIKRPIERLVRKLHKY